MDKMDQRVTVLRFMLEWEGWADSEQGFESARRKLSKLLDQKDWWYVKQVHRNEDDDGVITAHLRHLRGPHGRTYYKMLLARQLPHE